MSGLYSTTLALFMLLFSDIKIILSHDNLTAGGRKLAAVRPFVEEPIVSVEKRFPYLCKVRRKGSKTDACIGTLIAPFWALAAADCVDPTVPNSAGNRPVLLCGSRSGAAQKVFYTIDTSIHDLPTEDSGITSRFALLRINRDAQGPFPTLFPFEALHEDTTFTVLEPERTDMNVPVTILHTISAEELQSTEQVSKMPFAMKPQTYLNIRQEIQHNDDSTNPSLGAAMRSESNDYFNSDSPLSRGCVSGTCGAPIVVPNEVMDGTIKVGSGDSDVVVGFGFYFGDASTFVRFANATLQYLEPLFKCATRKTCSPPPPPPPSTPSRPVIPTSPVASAPVKASPSIPVASPSPETPVHHSVKETEHAATTSTEIVVKSVTVPEPELIESKEEKIVATLAPEPEITEVALSPAQVPQTTEETIVTAPIPGPESTEDVGSAPGPVPELTEKIVLEPVHAPAVEAEIASPPTAAPETTTEMIVSAPALAPTAEIIPGAPALATEHTEPTAAALSVSKPAKVLVPPVPEPETTEEAGAPSPVTTEEVIVPVSEPETFEKGPVAIPVPEPKQKIFPTVQAPAQESSKEAILPLLTPEPEAIEKETESVSVPVPTTAEEGLSILTPTPTEKSISSSPPVPESAEQVVLSAPTPTPEAAAEYVSPPSPELSSTGGKTLAPPLPAPSTEVICSSPSIVPATTEESLPPEVTAPAPSSTSQSEATEVPAPLESPVPPISPTGPQSLAASPSPAVSIIPQTPPPPATPKAAKFGRPKDCPEDTSDLSKQSLSKKFTMIKQMIPKDDEEGIRRVLCSGLDVNKHFGVQKLTLLHLAAMSNAANCISLLIESGAHINSKDSLGRTPIFETINVNATDAVKELVKYHADLEIYDRFGFTALMQAALENRVLILQEFIHAGADLEAPCKNPVNEGDTALYIAAALGCIQSVEVLLDHGADPNTIDKEGLTPLLSAAKHGHITVAKELIKAHARTDLVDKQGNTALHYAAQGGYLFIARDLVRAGADRSARNLDGKRPADLICKKPPPPMYHCQLWTYRLLQRLLSPRATT